MNDELKKVIVEELEDLNEYFHESGKEELLEEQIERLADNIISKLPKWEVVASGEVVGTGVVYIENDLSINIALKSTNVCNVSKLGKGKNIEIAVREVT